MKAKKALLILSSAFLLFSCQTAGGEAQSEPASESQEMLAEEESLQLDLFGERELPTDFSYEATIEDPSLLSIEDGILKAGQLSGETDVTLKGSDRTLIYHVKIVQGKEIPSFSLSQGDVYLRNGSAFSVDASLLYGGKEVAGYATFLVSQEEEESHAEVKAEGSKVQIKATSVGESHYTVYTEFLGYTLSLPLTVHVGEDQVAIASRRFSYDANGRRIDLSMYRWEDDPIDVSKDFYFYKGSEKAAGTPSFEISDPEVATIEENLVHPLKTGETVLKATLGDVSFEIPLSVSKPVIRHQDVKLEDAEFILNPAVSFDIASNLQSGTRTYGKSEESKAIPLPNDLGDFVGLYKVYLDGEEKATYPEGASVDNAAKTVTLPGSAFDASVYGKHEVTLQVEAGTFLYEYRFNLFFLTAEISKRADFDAYITQRFKGDTILGEYALTQDFDFGGKSKAGWTAAGWDYSTGFRGHLDGRNHAIANYECSTYGISAIIGIGAVLENLNFANMKYVSTAGANVNSGETTFLARGITSATIQNIEITLSEDSVASNGDLSQKSNAGNVGFFANSLDKCIVSDIIVHAENQYFTCLIAKGAGSTVFTNFVAYCQGADSLVQNRKTDIPGITIVTGSENA